MTWKNNRISKAIIYSELGGVYRICTNIPVKVVETTSTPATGPNPNPFYQIPPGPEFINNSTVPLQVIPVLKDYIIDFMTEKGKSYTLVQF
jgi:alpha-L-fucosidase 2